MGIPVYSVRVRITGADCCPQVYILPMSRKDRQNLHGCLPLTFDSMTANLTAEKFASIAFDYVVIGGGTAGLVVAARYVCLRLD